MPGVQSVARTNGAQIFRRKRLATLNVTHNEQRAAKRLAACLFWTASELNSAEGLLRHTNGIDHRFEFMGLEREGAVWPWFRTRQGEMLLDDARSQRNGCDGHRDAHRMIRKPCGHSETRRYLRDGPQV